LLALAWLVLAPAAAFAQASIVGVVKDTSGAVLPGVTVEASSPALIERTRTVVTDGTGQYRIETLPPGTYTVTYTLTGFNAVRREGLELTGTFTATANAELRVGALAETITVKGESPVVDVQGTTQERVIDKQVLDAIPSGRNALNYAVLIPGMVYGNAQDVGGAAGTASPAIAIHGGRDRDQIPLQNGVTIGSPAETGFSSTINMNPIATQEIAIDTASVSAELPSGGVRINYVARDGGNVFGGTVFGSFANDKMQGSNFTTALRDAGLRTPDSMKKNWDFNPGLGGPIRRDKIWFFASYRYYSQSNFAGGSLHNVNANKPDLWTYVPDPDRPGSNDANVSDGQVRVTWQATRKNKLGLNWHEQVNHYCLNQVSATQSPEAGECRSFPLQRQVLADWTSPLTNRLLFEAGLVHYFGISNVGPSPGLDPRMITVNEQSNGLRYRADDPQYRSRPTHAQHMRAVASYITGSHALKGGMTHTNAWAQNNVYANQPVIYRFNNGVPNQITELAYPFNFKTDLDHNLGLFAQDKWTIDRVTATYGLRFDYFSSSTPEQTLGPSPLTPNRNLTFPTTHNLSFKDITPKMGVAYDLFGTGKTAVKASLNKYVQALSTNLYAAAPNPINALVLSTARSWNDGNRNFVPDCDLLNTASNGECGALANPLFGSAQASTNYDPNILGGWGHRTFNWELSTGVQQEVLPRVSVDVAYFRRWYGNFTVTDNRAYAPSDYTAFSITSPVDSRLPGGGGQTVGGLYDLNPNKFGMAPDAYVTSASTYGKMLDHWNGFDFSINARPGRGTLLQGGVSTGKRTTDFCSVVANLPEVVFGTPNPNLIGILANVGFGLDANGVVEPPGTITPAQFCHQESGFQTQAKFLGSYTIPRAEVLISGTFQSLPGPAINSYFVATNAIVAPSLGRTLSGNAANVTTDIVAPGLMYGERLNQLDLRFGKILRYGATKTAINLDLYNALNRNPVLTVNQNYATWLRPNSILLARFAKVSLQFDF
jgi:hypothetical protein